MHTLSLESSVRAGALTQNRMDYQRCWTILSLLHLVQA